MDLEAESLKCEKIIECPIQLHEQMIYPNASRSSWAWLVLFSAFVCTAIVDGLILSFGLHILEMVENPSFTTWVSIDSEPAFYLYLLPGALLTGTHLYASPLANVLSNRFDCRPVAMVSALLSGLILVGSSFLQDIEAFGLLFGICGGLSCGLLYFPSLSIVAQWFEARRALPVGLAICGSGVGTCLIATTFPTAVKTFSWRGLLIVFGAVFLQLSVLIALNRPVEVQHLINLERSRQRATERRRRSERERISAELRRKKLPQISGQSVNQRRSITTRVTGGIMNRILEEKFRQRCTSTGSLDGLVITRDNELISLPSGADYEMARAAAVATVAGEMMTASHGRIGPGRLPPLPPSQYAGLSASDRSVNKMIYNQRIKVTQPHDFSKSGVIRIADAILQKLEAQAVIAPGMRCPDINAVFRPRPSGVHGLLSNDDSADSDCADAGRLPQRTSARSREASNATKVTSLTTTNNTMGTGTASSLYRQFSAVKNINVPTLYVSNDSGKAGWVDALDVGVSRNQLTPSLRSLSRSLSGPGADIETEVRIDPKTDRAIASELSRVYLDAAVKARIRAVIHRELRRHELINMEQQHQSGRAEAGGVPQRYSYQSLEVGSTEQPTARSNSIGTPDGDGIHYCATGGCDNLGGATTRPSSSHVSRCAILMGTHIEEKPSVIAWISDTLDLQLLHSPSFLLLSLACTLHMVAFFVPYQLLPLFVSLEGRTLSCGQLIWSSYFSSIFRVPERLASVTSVTFTVGIAHLLGRLIATFYIEHRVSESSHFQQTDDDALNSEEGMWLPKHLVTLIVEKLSDPLTLNILSLFVGGVCLLCLPLASLTIGERNIIPSCSAYTPLRGILYVLVFLHTVTSALAISLRSIIAVELIGVHHLTPAFVYLLVFQGSGAIIGPISIAMLTEVVPDVRIGSALLTETGNLLLGTASNPLNCAFYSSGVVFILSALAYVPLKSLSQWESRRYLAKRRATACPTAHSANFESTDLQVRSNGASFDDAVPSSSIGDTKATPSTLKQKAPQYIDCHAKISTCSRISELSYITFLMPNTPKT